MTAIKAIALSMVFTTGFGIASTAYAAESPYGFYTEAGIGLRSSSTETTVHNGGNNLFMTTGKTQFLESLGAGWRWKIDNFVVGAGLFWNRASADLGGAWISGTSPIKIKEKHHWGVDVDLGYKFADSNTIYTKLSWHRAQFTVESSAGAIMSNNHQGYGGGFGVRHLFSNHTYVFVEGQVVQFETKTDSHLTIEPVNSLAVMGVGVRF